MCDPITMAVVTIGTAVAGAYGQIQAGKAQNELYKYEAKQNEADARAEGKAAQVEAERIRKLGKQAVAEANVAQAGNGNDLASAGALNINRDITQRVEEDAYFTLVGGKDRSQRMLAQAQLNRMKGASAQQAGMFGAIGTLGSGITQAYGGWKKGTAG